MSFDPRTYTDTPARHADIFSLEGLRDWLRTQPPHGTYCFSNTSGCLLFQYLTARGIPVRSVGGWTYRDADGKSHNFPDYDPEAIDPTQGPLNQVSVGNPRTFGAALTRCAALLAKQT